MLYDKKINFVQVHCSSNTTINDIILDFNSDIKIPNNSNPSKKQILLQAVKDYGEEVDTNNITLYQLQHKLEKLVINK